MYAPRLTAHVLSQTVMVMVGGELVLGWVNVFAFLKRPLCSVYLYVQVGMYFDMEHCW